MLCNASTVLIGERVVLVPYELEHVDRYHHWMEDNALREATASERLDLDQERAMQREWRDDESKLTFIVLDRNQLNSIDMFKCISLLSRQQFQQFVMLEDEIRAMVGDINLFRHDYLDNDEAELDIMIAEKLARRKGLAFDAIQTIQYYARNTRELHTPHPLCRLIVKIAASNHASLALFRKLGFIQREYVQAFDEYTLQRSL